MKYLKTYLFFISLLILSISCEDDDYNCPSNIQLPPYTNDGLDIVACKINEDVWIGNEAELCHGSFYGCEPSFRIFHQGLKDEYGYNIKDKNGNFIFDSLFQIKFKSDFKFDCDNFSNTSFDLQVLASINSLETSGEKYKEMFIKYNVWTNREAGEREVYWLDFDKPYTFFVDLDTARRQASGTFSGIFEEHDTGKLIEITDGFFDMTEIGG